MSSKDGEKSFEVNSLLRDREAFGNLSVRYREYEGITVSADI